ncbi:MAG: potassium channel protein [Lachnospiraceae bacterium]|nr:potassium channel protein [Lachnospiraceae bacterium]
METKNKTNNWIQTRNNLYKTLQMGQNDTAWSWGYDILSVVTLVVNIVISFMYTFRDLRAEHALIFTVIEWITVLFFALDYVLRILAAPSGHPARAAVWSRRRYIISLTGIIDLLSFLPYFLPVVFPAGAVLFRLLRIVRIFRLFRINAYYDSFQAIGEVFRSKKQQLVSSFFILGIVMLAASLCMYGLEHDAQPDVFTNAFSGIWWAVSALLTVGYGDIYPITVAGQIAGIVIAFVGVMMVAIPTGIISAGFVEQYTRLKKMGDYAIEEDIHFIKIRMEKGDGWNDRMIKDLGLPSGIIIAALQRGQETLIPRGDVVVRAGDTLIIAAESLKNDSQTVNMKEVLLKKDHPWNGVAIRDLDISRQTFIVMVKRNENMIIPKGDMVLIEGDTIILYSKGKAKQPDNPAVF